LWYLRKPLNNLQKISKLYHNPEFSRSFLCSPRATELCM